MPPRCTKLCRLCATNSSNFKSLLDGHGQGNLLYEMTYKYFHPTIVDFEVAKEVTSICKKCCDHMWNFHTFQMSVREAQIKFAHYQRGDKIKTEQKLQGECQESGDTNPVEISNHFSVVKAEAESRSAHYEETLDSDEFNEFIIIEDLQPTSSAYDPSQGNVEQPYVVKVKEERTMNTNEIEISNVNADGLEDPSYLKDAMVVKIEKAVDKGFQPTVLNEDTVAEDEEIEKLLEMYNASTDHQEYTDENLKMPNAKGNTRCSSDTESANSGNDISPRKGENPKSKCILNTHVRRGRPEICSSDTESATSIHDFYNVNGENTTSQGGNEICPSDTESASSSNEYRNSQFSSNTHDRRGRPKICSSDTESVTSSKDSVNPKRRNIPNIHDHGIHTPLLSDGVLSSDNDLQPRIKKWQKSKFSKQLNDLLAKWMPNIKCVACPKTYRQLSRLVEHFSRQHPQDEFYIECCSRKLKQFYIIKQHFICHQYPDLFTCSVCDKPYTTASGIKYHVTTAHPEMVKFACKMCDELATTCQDLEQHLSSVHNMARATSCNMQVVYTCHQCEHTSPTVKALQEHMTAMHFRERVPFQCTHCCQSFVRSSDFREHLAGHQKKILYECAYCDQKFNWLADIYVHRQNAHPNESGTDLYKQIVGTFDGVEAKSADKDKEPKLDSKATGSADMDTKYHISLPELEIMDVNNDDDTDLSSNRVTNTPAAPIKNKHLHSSRFACDMCDKGFRKRKALHIHYALMHTQQENQAKADADEYSCRECERKFHKEFELLKHIWDMHKASPELKCIICDKKYRCIRHLREHLAAHRNRDVYACVHCPQTFRREVDVVRHRQREHAHKCEKKYFKLIPQAISYQSEPGDFRQDPAALQSELDKPTTVQFKSDALDYLTAMCLPNIKCFLCPASFAKLSIYRHHFDQMHPNEKFYLICCHRKFDYQYKIEQHMLLHSNPNVFQCAKCDITYRTKLSLRRHMAGRHPEIDQNKKCHNRFAKKQLLLTPDIAGKHPKTKAYTCEQCRKKFMNYQMFMVHRRYKHRQTTVKHECSVCGKTFKYSTIYRHHLVRHRD